MQKRRVVHKGKIDAKDGVIRRQENAVEKTDVVEGVTQKTRVMRKTRSVVVVVVDKTDVDTK